MIYFTRITLCMFSYAKLRHFDNYLIIFTYILFVIFYITYTMILFTRLNNTK